VETAVVVVVVMVGWWRVGDLGLPKDGTLSEKAAAKMGASYISDRQTDDSCRQPTICKSKVPPGFASMA
jgi:hypothetical protein